MSGANALPLPRSYRAILLPAFRLDLQEITIWSEVHFGTTASDRYVALIQQAMLDVLDNPERPGAKFRPELAPGALVYHLRLSRSRVPGVRVKSPRHFVLYRCQGEMVEFARLLHDNQDFFAYMPADW